MIKELWSESRKDGVGGSEISSVLNIGNWGCRCRLWDEKRDPNPPEIDPTTERIFKRGTLLEPLVINEFIEETGFKVIHGQALIDLVTGPGNPFADRCDTIITNKDGKDEVTFTTKGFSHRRATIDGLIVMPDETYRILECKTAMREVYYKLHKEGLDDSYNLQGQFYSGVLGLAGGFYAVLNPDMWAFTSISFEADEDLIKMVFDEVDKMWRVIENGPRPERLDPSDVRCKKCLRRQECQGDYLLQSIEEEGTDVPDLSNDPEFAQAAHDYIDAKDIIADATALKDEAEAILKEKIGNQPVVVGAGLKIHYKPQTRVAWDTKKLEKDHPELVSQYRNKESVSRPFRPFVI